MAVTRRDGGTGPLRLVGGSLRPVPDPAALPEDADRPERAEDAVRLTPERTARALLRFQDGSSDVVTGGGLSDWPLVTAAGLRSRDVRRDPASGLFGLAVARRDGFLADFANRRALSAALDRAAITAAVAPAWEPVDRIVPELLDSAAPPVVPEWSLLTLAERRAAARARVAAWRDGPVQLALALPDGPGATLLWGGIAASLRSIGVLVTRVGPQAPADLRLVDLVAPYDSARWYLANACQPCSTEAATALIAARDAPTTEGRSRLIAEADRLLDADVAFLPIARPLRWSVVGRRATGWQANARSRHPLNRLRADPN
jgi:peptide/nickel transport system substrate-binding protein